MSNDHKLDTAARDARKPDAAIQDLLLTRWSPRAMSGDAITDDEFASLFEAARWAPSSTNSQPWRFVHARRGSPHWDALLGLLTERNQRWAKHGAMLAVALSISRDSAGGKELVTHSYDTGAAWENIALQGRAMGLVVHGMQGFDYARARIALKVPDSVAVEAMFVVGRPGSIADLPEDLQAKETPSKRKPVSEFVFEGTYENMEAAG